MSARTVAWVVVSLTFVFASAPPLSAKSGRAEVRGSVVDQKKGVIPGVTVTVTQTSPTADIVTNDASSFNWP